MKNYIDIHSHILPQIDDGAENFNISIKMLRLALEDGICGIIVTPHNKPMHHNADPEKIKILTKELQDWILKKGLDMQLYIGNEMHYGSDLTQKLEEGKACTLAGSSYILIEFNPMDDFDHIRYGIYEALAHGYRPIVAHVERYGRILSKMSHVEDLIRMGCYIQVNAGSIMGSFGFETKQFTRHLLREKFVHFVATDAHDAEKRKPELGACAEYISKKHGRDYASQLTYENPMHVIRNEYI